MPSHSTIHSRLATGVDRWRASLFNYVMIPSLTRSNGMDTKKVSFRALQVRLRQAAKTALEERGFKTVNRAGKGIPPAARLIAKPGKGPELEVAIRTSRERALGYPRLDNGHWRTLERDRVVLPVAPG